MQRIEDSPIYRIMHPRSVAVLGASNSQLTMGTTILHNLLFMGFEGSVYPVHPTLKKVMGLKAYASVEALPAVPDLAVLVLPTQIVPRILDACGKKGIRRAIIVSGGFRESGEDGKRMEQELLEIADKHKIRFIGPNCIGVVNPAYKYNTTMFHYNAATDGFIGMASQSGSFVTQVFISLERFGLGFSQAVSVGNQANIDLADCVEYLGACPRTKVIGIYMEGLLNSRRFVRIASKVARKKPIVAVYVGGTEAGGRAGFSHTGALSGSDALYDGLFSQCGILRAHSMEELFDFCWVLGSQPLMRGNRTAIVTGSGGPGTAAADAAERAGLWVPPLSLPTREKLASAVPEVGSLNNPIDVTYTRNFEDLYMFVPRVLLEDEDVDGVLLYFLFLRENFQRLLGKAEHPLFHSLEEFDTRSLDLMHRFSKLARSFDKPLVGSSLLTRSDACVRALEDHGIPVLPSPERSAKALGALYRYSRMRQAWAAEESAE